MLALIDCFITEARKSFPAIFQTACVKLSQTRGGDGNVVKSCDVVYVIINCGTHQADSRISIRHSHSHMKDEERRSEREFQFIYKLLDCENVEGVQIVVECRTSRSMQMCIASSDQIAMENEFSFSSHRLVFDQSLQSVQIELPCK